MKLQQLLIALTALALMAWVAGPVQAQDPAQQPQQPVIVNTPPVVYPSGSFRKPDPPPGVGYVVTPQASQSYFQTPASTNATVNYAPASESVSVGVSAPLAVPAAPAPDYYYRPVYVASPPVVTYCQPPVYYGPAYYPSACYSPGIIFPFIGIRLGFGFGFGGHFHFR